MNLNLYDYAVICIMTLIAVLLWWIVGWIFNHSKSSRPVQPTITRTLKKYKVEKPGDNIFWNPGYYTIHCTGMRHENDCFLFFLDNKMFFSIGKGQWIAYNYLGEFEVKIPI